MLAHHGWDDSTATIKYLMQLTGNTLNIICNNADENEKSAKAD